MKIKILFIIDSLTGGGSEKVLMHILKKINREIFDIELLVIVKKGIYLSQIPKDIKCRFLVGDGERMKSLGLFFLFRLYRRFGLYLFKKFPHLISKLIKIDDYYDIGISFCQGDNSIILKEKKKAFNHRILWIHTDMSIYLKDKKECSFWKKRLDLDYLFFVSENAKNQFLSFFPDDLTLKKKSKVIYNPIDVSTIKNEVKHLKEEKKEHPLQMLAIGRLVYIKRFDRLLNIHRRLLDEGIYHELVILGTGPEEKKLREQINTLGINKTCQLKGFQNPYPYLFLCDIFVSSSEIEGFSLVIAEAMILSKPIVSTNAAGPMELLEKGKYGLLTENNEDALYEGIKKMLLDDDLRNQYTETLLSNQNNFIIKEDIKNIENVLVSINENEMGR